MVFLLFLKIKNDDFDHTTIVLRWMTNKSIHCFVLSA